MIDDLVNKKCTSTRITLSGANGYYTTNFKKDRKIYVLGVGRCNNKDVKKIKFKFDKKTNKLECWDTSCRYGSVNIVVKWVESDYHKRINV